MSSAVHNVTMNATDCSTRCIGIFKSVLPFEQEVEYLLGAGEGPVGGEEHVDVRRLQLAHVRGQALHQLLQRASLDEAHAHSLPLQVRYVVVRLILRGEASNSNYPPKEP